ncbi:MAG: branched-chain amino acid ABC transporter permease [Gaiellaceae bacterium]
MLPTLHDLVQFVPVGLAVGAVYGVSGVGIVVLYRTTGVLNFAYGAIGALGVFIAYELIFKTSWCPNWAAYVACIAVGGVVTLVYGLVFGPIFAARDPLVKSAATLGLTLMLLAIMSWVWPVNEVTPVPLPSDNWHNYGYQIGDVRVSWTVLIALMFAFGVTAVTSVFLRYTKLGTAYRALANDREITATLGVPVRVVEASAWLVSGLVCGASGLLLAGLNHTLEAATLTFIVISSLAAALIGRLQSLWITLIAALLIGVVESCLQAFSLWPNQSQPLAQYRAMTPFVLAIAALLVLGRRSLADARVGS